MSSHLDLFVWHRAEGGYEWRDDKTLNPENQSGLSKEDEIENRFLVKKPMATPRHLRYNPLLKYPTLYKSFAELEPTEAAYAEFANKYGELGVGVFTVDQGFEETPDPFCRWREAHATMRPVADVLSAIQTNDIEALKKWFVIAKNGARYHREASPGVRGELGWVTIDGELKEFLWTWAMKAKSDSEILLRVARGWAQEHINNELGGDKHVGSSRVDLQACKLEYSIVSPK